MSVWQQGLPKPGSITMLETANIDGLPMLILQFYYGFKVDKSVGTYATSATIINDHIGLLVGILKVFAKCLQPQALDWYLASL
jgi:hypothetical protein